MIHCLSLPLCLFLSYLWIYESFSMPSPRLQEDEDFSQSLSCRLEIPSWVIGSWGSRSLFPRTSSKKRELLCWLAWCLSASNSWFLTIWWHHVSQEWTWTHIILRSSSKSNISPPIYSLSLKNDQSIHDSKGNSGNKPGWGYSGFNPRPFSCYGTS